MRPTRKSLDVALLIALVLASLSIPSSAQSPTSGAASTYSDEPLVIERTETVVSVAADGTGWKERTLAARLQSDAGVKRFSVLTIAYASSSQRVEIAYVRVTHADGTTAETPSTDAMDMPAAVTRAAPFYSDIKELQLPVRGLRAGDRIEYKYRIVRTKPETPGQFWGQESLNETAVALEQTLELRLPAGMAVQVWSPTLKPVESTTAGAPAQHIYRWSSPQLSPTVGKDAEARKKLLWTPEQELDAEQGKLPTVAWTTFKSWEEVGAWYRGLETDRIVADDTVKAKVAELIQGKVTDEDKARALYAYVATSIRYIGVSFGIGRYQPHTAAEILSNQYGDCKDKHTLLAAMLSAAGIQSDAVLIGAGIRFNEAVPSPASFNHLITRANVAGKSVWLDTTAEVAPWGMLVRPTRDKQALAVLPNGAAMVVRTPAEPPVADATAIDAAGSLDTGGVSTSRVTITFHGDAEIATRAAFRLVPPDKYDAVVQAIAKGIGFSGTTSNPEVSRPTDMTQPFTLAFDYKREKAGDWEQLKTLPQVAPVVLPQVTDIDPPVRAIQLGAPRTVTSTSSMKLPQGWSAALPPAIHARCDYATYDMTYRLADGTLYADRKTAVLSKKVPVSDWKAYMSFVDEVKPGRERYIQLLPAAAVKGTEQSMTLSEALASPDPIVRNAVIAAEDVRHAGIASEYAAQLAGTGDAGATRVAASRAAMAADKTAAAAETAAAIVEADASKARAASAAGDRASMDRARDKATSDYAALLAADDQLARDAKDLATAAAANASFYATNPGNTAVNDLAAQDSSAAANLLSAATNGGSPGYSAAAANEATAMKDANTMAGLDPARVTSFRAVAKAEAEAQSAATAEAAATSTSAEAAAATAGATADGTANPYAGAIETGAAAVANAASGTISAKHALDGLRTLK